MVGPGSGPDNEQQLGVWRPKQQELDAQQAAEYAKTWEVRIAELHERVVEATDVAELRGEVQERRIPTEVINSSLNAIARAVAEIWPDPDASIRVEQNTQVDLGPEGAFIPVCVYDGRTSIEPIVSFCVTTKRGQDGKIHHGLFNWSVNMAKSTIHNAISERYRELEERQTQEEEQDQE